MERTPFAPEYAARLSALRSAMKDRGVSKAELARRTGRSTEAEMVYFRRVLGGGSVSDPVLTDAEKAMEDLERAAAPVEAR